MITYENFHGYDVNMVTNSVANPSGFNSKSGIKSKTKTGYCENQNGNLCEENKFVGQANYRLQLTARLPNYMSARSLA